MARTTKVGRARNAVTYAIKTGRLKRGPCEVCGEPNGDAHHDDYDKPLDVRWLCKLHHNQLHRHPRTKSAKAKHAAYERARRARLREERIENGEWQGQGVKNAKKRKCPEGHAYTDANTYVTKAGGRQCRICRRIAARRRRAAQRQK